MWSAAGMPDNGGHMALLPPPGPAPQEDLQVHSQSPPQLSGSLWHGR